MDLAEVDGTGVWGHGHSEGPHLLEKAGGVSGELSRRRPTDPFRVKFVGAGFHRIDCKASPGIDNGWQPKHAKFWSRGG